MVHSRLSVFKSKDDNFQPSVNATVGLPSILPLGKETENEKFGSAQLSSKDASKKVGPAYRDNFKRFAEYFASELDHLDDTSLRPHLRKLYELIDCEDPLERITKQDAIEYESF